MKRVLALIALLLFPATSAAQSVTTGISRDTVRVGDPVRVILRIDGIPANTEIVLPDSLAAIDDVENAGRLRMRRDTMAGGLTRITAAYPVIIWRPGETALPALPMIVRTNGSERATQLALPTINVISVLPPDTTNIEAKPPKDVWGADRIWWPWLLAALLALIAAVLLYWWYRRRRAARAEVPVIPFVDPRAEALQEIQRIRALGLIEQKQYRQHYILLSEVLRVFAGRMEPEWSTDLTTDELAPRIKPRKDAYPLLAVLRSADMVKFARRQPAAADAHKDVETAEAWVREFNKPEPVAAAEAA
ncbi:MAG TPA: DUF4381 family protein [Longimicrobiales bacterium]